MPLVVDASVVAKWFFSEEDSDAARVLLDRASELIAPEFIRVELVAVAWKKAQRGQIPSTGVTELPSHIADLPMTFVRDLALLQSASEIAVRFDRTVYDSLYVALALQEGCQFVTADLRLYNSLRDAFPQTMVWVADLAATEGN